MAEDAKKNENVVIVCDDDDDDPAGDASASAFGSVVTLVEGNNNSGRPPSVRRKFRTLTFGRRYKTKCGAGGGSSGSASGGGGGGVVSSSCKDGGGTSKKRKGPWNFKFNYRLRRGPTTDIPEPSVGCDSCVCTGYRRTEEHHLGAGVVFQANNNNVTNTTEASSATAMMTRSLPGTGVMSSNASQRLVVDHNHHPVDPIIDLSKFNPDDYPIEDWEERARAERARELEEGVDPPPGYHPASPMFRRSGGHQLMAVFDMKLMDLAAALQNRLAVNSNSTRFVPTARPLVHTAAASANPAAALMMNSSSSRSSETHLIGQVERVTSQGCCLQRTVHTQVDYIHCLVPDLHDITRCSFYWGKMDRYEAERLLDTKAEGTFLLRDSAQEEYLFSVSFRRYGRSLHARIEQWNHKFSFDSHDPGVFASGTVCGLIEHYKDPSCCLFFEPMLTIPLHRNFPFPLQHLSRAAICKQTTYDGVNALRLPKSLKAYLKEYHYKQRVRVRMFELEH